MLPINAINNHPYGTAGNIKFSCQGRLIPFHRKSPPYFDDIFWGQFTHSVLFASWHCFMMNRIFGIVFRCPPIQIIKSIIKRISVFMATLKTLWPLTQKGIKYQTVNPKSFCLMPKANLGISSWVCNCQGQWVGGRFQYMIAPFPKRSNISVVANFITREPRNGFPNFLNCVKGIFSHDVSSLLGNIVVRAGGIFGVFLRPVLFYSISFRGLSI